MRLKNYVVVILFVVFISLLTIQQESLEEDIIEKVNNYEVETLDSLYNLTKLVMEYKIDRIEEISTSLFDSSKIKELENQMKKYSKEETSDFYTDYIVILDDGRIITTLEKNEDGSYFDVEENEAIEELYNLIRSNLSNCISNRFVKNKELYSIYFGGPMYDGNGEFIGIVATRFNGKNLDRFLTNIIGDAKIEFTILQNNEEIYTNHKKVKKYYTEKLNDGCENELYIPELNVNYKLKYNIYDGNYILYIPLILIYSFALSFTLYLFKKLKQDKRTISIYAILWILSIGAAINVVNIVVHRIYRDNITEMNNYTISHIVYETIYYSKTKETKVCFTLGEDIQKYVDSTPSINENNCKEMIIKNFKDYFDVLLSESNRLGHIYIYGSDRSFDTYPVNNKLKNIYPKDEPFIDYSNHKNAMYVDVEYDSTYQNTMMYYMYPIIKDENLLCFLMYEFDFEYLRKELLDCFKNLNLKLSYLDEDNNHYEVNGGKIEYIKKYGLTVEAFENDGWTDTVKDRIYYEKIYDEDKVQEYEVVYSKYINGLIYVSDIKTIKWYETLRKIVNTLIVYLALGGSIIIFAKKKKNAEDAIKNI